MLHVLNGDATATVFARAGLDGERLVWRDILAEGPVAADADTPARLDARAAYLAERLTIDREAYVRARAAAGVSGFAEFDWRFGNNRLGVMQDVLRTLARHL